MIGNNIRSTGESPSVDYFEHNDRKSTFSRYIGEEYALDAASEKEQGNEHFKQKNYNEAIDCYSRSIALQPTAVAYANRAMAYLKIKRFEDAEADCTEALNLDDRYIKAYSRRITARKELGKLRESLEDSEFALKLEPDNQDIKKQHTEIKSLYKREILYKSSAGNRSDGNRTGVTGKQKDSVKEQNKVPTKLHPPVEEVERISMDIEDKKAASGGTYPRPARNGLEKNKLPTKLHPPGEEVERISMDIEDKKAASGGTYPHPGRNGLFQKNGRMRKGELDASIQELASRAASRAAAEAMKNISTPNSAYQFEISWKALSGDTASQVHLLKTIPPHTLPEIFKNALTAQIVVDMVNCIATFFMEEMELAVGYLENLVKVSRFSMIIMCLGSSGRTDIRRTWERVFHGDAIPMEYVDALDKLRPFYCHT